MHKCPVCNKELGRLGRHFQREHPEYKWTREIREGVIFKHFYCGICGRSVASFGDLVIHYSEFHNEEIKPTEPHLTTISEPNLTVSDLDRLLEQVNINTNLLKEEQNKNRELIEKCTAYASRIVELQNQLAQENKNRY